MRALKVICDDIVVAVAAAVVAGGYASCSYTDVGVVVRGEREWCLHHHPVLPLGKKGGVAGADAASSVDPPLVAPFVRNGNDHANHII